MSKFVYFINSAGEVGEVPADKAQDYTNLGYVPASTEQVEQFKALDEHRKKYGTVGQQVLTGIETGGSALTFGLSDVVAGAIGGEEYKEARKAREEVNPLAGGTGTVVGTAIPLILSGGTSAPASGAQAGVAGARGAVGALQAGARLTGPAVASRVAGAVTRGLEGALASPGAGVAGQVLRRAASLGAGSAVEGALYGTGQVVSEAALGDPVKAGESALATIGLSALMGGGMGALGGATAVALPKAVGVAKESFQKGLNRARGLTEDALVKAQAAITGLPEDKIALIYREREKLIDLAETEAMNKLGVEAANAERMKLRAQLADDMVASIKEQHKAITDVERLANKTIRPAERVKLASHVDPDLARKQYIGTMDNIQAVADDLLAKPELPKIYGTELKKLRDMMWREYKKDMPASQVYEKLNNLKKDFIDGLVDFDGVPAKDHAMAMDVVKRNVRDSLKDLLENEQIWGAGGRRQAQFNENYSALIRKRQFFEKHFTTGPKGKKVFDEQKARRFFKRLGKDGEINALESLQGYLDAGKNYVDEVGQAHWAAPDAPFDGKALRTLNDKTGKLVAEGRAEMMKPLEEYVESELSQIVGEFQETAPPPGGVIGGIGTAAAAPLVESMLPGAGPIAMLYGAVKTVGGTYNALKNVPKTARTLIALERTLQTVSTKIDTAVNYLARGVVKAAPIGRAEVLAGVAKEFADSPEQAEKKHAKYVEDLNKLTIDAEHLEKRLTEGTALLTEHAPNVSMAVQIGAVRKLNFLKSKLPQPPSLGPLAPKWKPSRSDIAKFNRYKVAVEKPLTVLKQAMAGTLTPEAVEAVKVTDPVLYEEIQMRLLEKIGEAPEKVPYRNRLMLALLMGGDMDGSLNPGAMMSRQSVFAGPPPEAPPPSSGKAEKITLADRTLTPGQASAQRRS